MSYDRLRRITELREQERLLSQARLVVQQRLIQARMELGSYLKDQILFSYFYSTLRLFVKEGEGQHMQTQQNNIQQNIYNDTCNRIDSSAGGIKA